jgi:hypothetical protein
VKNLCGKTRPQSDPYEIWQSPDGTWTWLVLKKWQADDDKPYARWFCAVYTPMTYGSYDLATKTAKGSCDLGDTYVADIKRYARKVA